MRIRFLLLLLTGAVCAHGAFSQEEVEIQQDKIVLSGASMDDILTLFADGSDFGGSACAGLTINESVAGARTLTFNGCAPILVIGGTDFAGALQVIDASGRIAGVINGSNGTATLGASSGNPGLLQLRDTNGLTTLRGDGEFGSLVLGSESEDGDIIVYDAEPDQEGFRVDGNTGDITNQLDGSGSVKAWARVSSSGTILSCWRCNSGSNVKSSTGIYDISFPDLGTNIQSRPRTAVIDSHSISVNVTGMVNVAGTGDIVTVVTRNASGTLTDLPFTVLVY